MVQNFQRHTSGLLLFAVRYLIVLMIKRLHYYLDRLVRYKLIFVLDVKQKDKLIAFFRQNIFKHSKFNLYNGL